MRINMVSVCAVLQTMVAFFVRAFSPLCSELSRLSCRITVIWLSVTGECHGSHQFLNRRIAGCMLLVTSNFFLCPAQNVRITQADALSANKTYKFHTRSRSKANGCPYHLYQVVCILNSVQVETVFSNQILLGTYQSLWVRLVD